MMKKIIMVILNIMLLLNSMPYAAFAADVNIVEDVQLKLKTSENPNRLEVSFNLTEPIRLSQANANISIEYFTQDSNGNLEITYQKDKSWSGYLNSYDNYPAGEQKYSSGYANDNYSDTVPAARIYTSTKTSAKFDVTVVQAVKITVLRTDGSGQAVTIRNDGTIIGVEKIKAPYIEEIEISIVDQNNTGIIINTNTTELPIDTIVVATEVKSGPIYEQVSVALTEVKNFVAIDIVLELHGNEIKPNGKIEINIPIPENIRSSNAAVFRIDNNGDATPYPVIITEADGIEYATFETEHFSIYVLAETPDIKPHKPIPNGKIVVREEKVVNYDIQEDLIAQNGEIKEENEAPSTGATSLLNSNMMIGILFLAAFITLLTANKKVNTSKNCN